MGKHRENSSIPEIYLFKLKIVSGHLSNRIQFQETFLSDCFLKRKVLGVKVLLSSRLNYSVGWNSTLHYRAMLFILVQLVTVQ